MKKLVKYLILLIIVLIIVVLFVYKYNVSAVTKENKPIEFFVEKNSSYLSITKQLKENNLIKSELFYKIFIKLHNPKKLETGNYHLNQNMDLNQLIEKFELGSEAKVVTFTIPEGKHITDAADKIASVTKLKSEDLINYWQDKKTINKLIDKYWFITEDIKNKNLRYNLEGYFFPAKYEIYQNSTKEEITYKMLDKMDQVLSKYKSNIKDYSIHEILTLASIVEHEAILDSDRPKIARVFLNRLDKNMKLQSCATIGYAINEWKLAYNNKDLAVDSFYNTYKYEGLPVGPGGLPGEKSIKAVIYPDDNDYLYFLADVYDEKASKTYYSKTYKEHQNKCLRYLGRSC